MISGAKEGGGWGPMEGVEGAKCVKGGRITSRPLLPSCANGIGTVEHTSIDVLGYKTEEIKS